MTPEQRAWLDEVQARVEKATEGPWYRQTTYGKTRAYEDVTTGIQTVARLSCDYDNAVQDVYFIAHSREDIPRLVALVRELDGEVENLTELLSLYREQG